MSTTMTRQEWLPCLIDAGRESVLSTANNVASQYTIKDLALPASGLGVLTMKDGAYNESFFLGEFPMAQAQVEMSDDKGNIWRGAAHVMNDDVDYARALAILDAALVAGADDKQKIAELVEEGRRRRVARTRERKAILANTRVDFAELSTTDGDDGDDE